ncbi:MAG: Cytochrome oxidase, cbb3-type, subunit [Solirubrobacteraceae bacterium]|nr:Cytochrome oxidase, cbb3-type, subunit [Solirubrobacteraceae bacterium]
MLGAGVARRPGYPLAVAKRKPTSRPRADRSPQAPGPAPGRPQKRAGTAPRGRASAGRQGPGTLSRAAAAVRRFGFLIVLVVAVGGAIALGVRQGSEQRSKGFGEATTGQATQAPFRSNQEAAKGQPVKELFGHTCGTCHTLRAAGVTGGIGPDLDRSVLTAAAVRRMIRTGSLDTTMPRNLLVGEEADKVSRYVARLSSASRRARDGR